MATLTSKERDKLKPSQFALPAQKAYPIPDIAHARDALARAAANATPAQQRIIQAAVYAKFPELKPKTNTSSTTGTGKPATSGTKPKFGSPAYRAEYDKKK